MGFHKGPNIVRDGLVFGYDADDRSNRFYKGEPTTNYIWTQNPRIDLLYSPWDMSSMGGTMTQNHPCSIFVYNQNGDDIKWYINQYEDWTNYNHAYWIFDSILQKPVVRLHNRIGNWQAKYLSLYMNSWSSLGYGIGTKYTISWLQWTNNINRTANVGMYTPNSSGNWNFWDGISDFSVSSKNTLPFTWQKVYHTFTVSGSWDLSQTLKSIYMYGMYNGVGEIRISDVQFEIKNHPTQFCDSLTRLSINSLIDLKKTTSIDLSNVSFDSTAHPIFDGTDDYIEIPLSFNPNINGFTFECILNTSFTNDDMGGYRTLVKFLGEVGWNGILFEADSRGHRLDLSDTLGNRIGSNSSVITPANVFQHLIWIWKNGVFKLYINGIMIVNSDQGSYISTTINGIRVGKNGSLPWIGKIPVVKIYNKVLTDIEIQQNFQSYKHRFNL